MRMVKVKLKSGEEVSGPMWTWRPTLGWFTVAGVNVNRRIYLRDVESAISEPYMTHAPLEGCRSCPSCEGMCEGIGITDYLALARKEGWGRPISEAMDLIQDFLNHCQPRCRECNGPATRVAYENGCFPGSWHICDVHVVPPEESREGVEVLYQDMPIAGPIRTALKLVSDE